MGLQSAQVVSSAVVPSSLGRLVQQKSVDSGLETNKASVGLRRKTQARVGARYSSHVTTLAVMLAVMVAGMRAGMAAVMGAVVIEARDQAATWSLMNLSLLEQRIQR